MNPCHTCPHDHLCNDMIRHTHCQASRKWLAGLIQFYIDVRDTERALDLQRRIKASYDTRRKLKLK